MLQKIDLVDHFSKKAEKLFDSIEAEAAADFDSNYLSINFLYKDVEFIGSRFIANLFDPKKLLEKTNLLGFEYCLAF